MNKIIFNYKEWQSKIFEAEEPTAEPAPAAEQKKDVPPSHVATIGSGEIKFALLPKKLKDGKQYYKYLVILVDGNKHMFQAKDANSKIMASDEEMKSLFEDLKKLKPTKANPNTVIKAWKGFKQKVAKIRPDLLKRIEGSNIDVALTNGKYEKNGNLIASLGSFYYGTGNNKTVTLEGPNKIKVVANVQELVNADTGEKLNEILQFMVYDGDNKMGPFTLKRSKRLLPSSATGVINGIKGNIENKDNQDLWKTVGSLLNKIMLGDMA